MKQLRVSEAGQEYQCDAKQSRDQGRLEGFLSFRRSDYRYGRAGHIILLDRPSGDPIAESKATAGFLAPGSSPLATFPVSQWYAGHWLSDDSCGGSRGLEHCHPSPRSLLIPVGNRRQLDKVRPAC
jgi:hypothetical protein